ncbi:hypothetical protein MELB17_12506 [Marinobacter sp. ELB17]|nr:hypothetical protein MELB17_12506 [Marinobacter sp. ELB17]
MPFGTKGTQLQLNERMLLVHPGDWCFQIARLLMFHSFQNVSVLLLKLTPSSAKIRLLEEPFEPAIKACQRSGLDLEYVTP